MELINENFNEEEYLLLNADVSSAVKRGDLSSAREHFLKYGRNEGRACSLNALREHFVTDINTDKSTLEIGPFTNPIITGKNVEYFDVLSTTGLQNRARQFGFSIDRIPLIKYVQKNGDLSIVRDKFHQVVSSHLIEHQPCLITHLNNVENILVNGGLYYLIVPDKRYCFDHFVSEKKISDVLGAYDLKRNVHTLSSVLEHRALTTHNDPVRHWKGDHGGRPNPKELYERIQLACDEYYLAFDSYIDVHAWQFTPLGFCEIIEALNGLNLCKLELIQLNNTPYGRFEFTAILKKHNE